MVLVRACGGRKGQSGRRAAGREGREGGCVIGPKTVKRERWQG